MALARFNPSIPDLPRIKNPRRRGRKGRRKNPSYKSAAVDVLGAPIVGVGIGALAGLVVAGVARPERIRYAVAMGALLGLGVVAVMEVDAKAHGAT